MENRVANQSSAPALELSEYSHSMVRLFESDLDEQRCLGLKVACGVYSASSRSAESRMYETRSSTNHVRFADEELRLTLMRGRPLGFIRPGAASSSDLRGKCFQKEILHALAATAQIAHAGSSSKCCRIMIGERAFDTLVVGSCVYVRINPQEVFAGACARLNLVAEHDGANLPHAALNDRYGLCELPVLRVGITGSMIALEIGTISLKGTVPTAEESTVRSVRRVVMLMHAPQPRSFYLIDPTENFQVLRQDIVVDVGCALWLLASTEGMWTNRFNIITTNLPGAVTGLLIQCFRESDGPNAAWYLGGHFSVFE